MAIACSGERVSLQRQGPETAFGWAVVRTEETGYEHIFFALCADHELSVSQRHSGQTAGVTKERREFFLDLALLTV